MICIILYLASQDRELYSDVSTVSLYPHPCLFLQVSSAGYLILKHTTIACQSTQWLSGPEGIRTDHIHTITCLHTLLYMCVVHMYLAFQWCIN